MAPDGKTVILPTSTEFTVKEVEINQHGGYRVWLLKIVTDDGLFRQIFVLHESKISATRLNLKKSSRVLNAMDFFGGNITGSKMTCLLKLTIALL